MAMLRLKTVVKALIHTSLDSTPNYTATTCHSILSDEELAGGKKNYPKT